MLPRAIRTLIESMSEEELREFTFTLLDDWIPRTAVQAECESCPIMDDKDSFVAYLMLAARYGEVDNAQNKAQA